MQHLHGNLCSSPFVVGRGVVVDEEGGRFMEHGLFLKNSPDLTAIVPSSPFLGRTLLPSCLYLPTLGVHTGVEKTASCKAWGKSPVVRYR